MMNMMLLKPGDNGVFVEYLTLALERSGFSAGGIGDDFNSKVYNALVAFQNAAGLAADGVAGEQTWNKLLPYLTGYTQITTLPGDTLASVASAYSTTQEAIETANPFISDFNLTPNTTLTVPYGFDVVPENVKYSYFLTVLIVDGLRARYPFMSVSSAGESVMGRDLLYMTIGEGSTGVFANASHHANEWITTPLLLKYAEDCLKAVSVGGYIDGEQASRLFEGKKLFVMPLVNPDGVDLVTGALSAQSEFYLAARSIAAEYRSIPFPDGWKANIEGTDLNLNYPAGWQYAKEIKAQQGFTSPAPRDYVGTAPLSALESRAVYNFTISHNFALALSYHTQGEVIYWKYLDYNPKGAEEIGNALALASGYSLENTPYSSGFAGYKDWFISFYNRPGYTVEAGIGENPLPISDFPSIYPPNRCLITTALASV